jgi:hypothetical protein
MTNPPQRDPTHPDHQLFLQVQLLLERIELSERQLDRLTKSFENSNGWRESAKMVLSELERQGSVLEKYGERFTHLQEILMGKFNTLEVSIVEARVENRGTMELVDNKIKAVCRKIGNSEPCSLHTKQLTQIKERVEQHVTHQDQMEPDLWREISTLRSQVATVDKASGMAQVEWKTWLLVFGVGGTSGGIVLGGIKLISWLLSGG